MFHHVEEPHRSNRLSGLLRSSQILQLARRFRAELLLLSLMLLFFYNIQSSLTSSFSPTRCQEMYERFLRSTSTEIFTLWDADLYALAGWQYVHGVSPDKINFEHPPLAKYLIGVSEVLFGNQNMLSAIFGGLTLVVAYLTSRKMFGPSLFGLVPVSMLSFDRMFLSYSANSTLDIYLTFFVALSSLLFIHAIKKPAFFVLV